VSFTLIHPTSDFLNIMAEYFALGDDFYIPTDDGQDPLLHPLWREAASVAASSSGTSAISPS
jgi:hypothetical protein